MKIFNSLTRKIEEFEPLEKGKVKIYTCGPTVYDYVSIGNWRTYFLSDLVIRTLKYLGYSVDYVMNITDVGHLTGDNLGDADTGVDRLEKGAKREGKTAWEIAEFYTKDFLNGYGKLHLSMPMVFSKATDHIEEQIELVKKIEEKGFAYKINDGIYFDTVKYEEAGNKYGELSNIDEVKEGARVAKNPEKKDPRDFALWKFSPKDEKRQMEWDSPWGKGFPGWHIECSAMSMKYLGEQIDIHIGGEDLRSTHHPNEIAQSECVTGKRPFSKYWMHGAFLQVDGGKMGKSLGNVYTLQDLKERGYEPEHLRYFYLGGNYRQPLNFTWQSMKDAKRTYNKLVNRFVKLETKDEKETEKTDEFENRFREILENDLNTPELLALVWEMIKSEDLKDNEKSGLLVRWDEVLGLNLVERAKVESRVVETKGNKTDMVIEANFSISEEVVDLIEERELARKAKEWDKSDKLRDKLTQMGYVLKDRSGKVIVEKL